MRILLKIRLLLPVLALAAIVAGCGGGGGSSSLDSGDVAVVGDLHISKAAFDDIVRQQQLTLKSQGQKLPKPGSSEYQAIRDQALAVAVQNAEFEQQAQKLGVAPTAKDVEDQLASIKKQYFGGSEKKYLQSLKQQGFTDAEVRQQVKALLTSQALYDKVTGAVQPTSQEIHDYYASHKADFPPTRRVSEILVGKDKEALAKKIRAQLAHGASFAALAKKYSQDPGSKNTGGLFTAQQGKDVPEFDAAVFSDKAKKGDLLQPVKTKQYGWFVIKILGDTKSTSEKEAVAQISSQLIPQKRNKEMTNWVSRISKSYCKGGQIEYQAGYQPVPDPCDALAAAAATTTAP
jgi:foldase protein PrsA